jgi:sulfocyanin
MTSTVRRAAAAAAALVVSVLGSPPLQPAGAAAQAAFTLVAAETPANGEMNYNGTDHGKLTITVPEGAHVVITLTNKGTLPHSFQVIPSTKTLPSAALPAPALPGAQAKNPQVGINKGQTETISFTASKPGKYLFICGFPGHALLGMWGNFIVSPNPATKPSMVVAK